MCLLILFYFSKTFEFINQSVLLLKRWIQSYLSWREQLYLWWWGFVSLGGCDSWNLASTGILVPLLFSICSDDIRTFIKNLGQAINDRLSWTDYVIVTRYLQKYTMKDFFFYPAILELVELAAKFYQNYSKPCPICKIILNLLHGTDINCCKLILLGAWWNDFIVRNL